MNDESHKIEHFYFDIGEEEWFDYWNIYLRAVMEAKDGDRFVEIGAWKGRSACFMAVEIINSGKDIKFDCIDNWSLGDTREEFLKNIEPVKHIINVINMDSLEAAKLYEDNSIKFCFSDGNHTYPYVTKEIKAFLPKIKSGGILAGHDYASVMDGDNQVYNAVNDTLGINNITTDKNVWIYEKP